MSIATKVKKVVDQFVTKHARSKGKVYLTSGSRTWQEQLDIILDPKRKLNYTGIKSRFLAAYKLRALPTQSSSLTAEQLKWWQTEIMKQAGRSPGFPHVGGKAQDVSVRLLSLKEKQALKKEVEGAGMHVLLEQVTGTTSKYGVAISVANVFHIYEAFKPVPSHAHHK